VLPFARIPSDRVVRERLGPARPITTERERAEILEALTMVDAVVETVNRYAAGRPLTLVGDKT